MLCLLNVTKYSCFFFAITIYTEPSSCNEFYYVISTGSMELWFPSHGMVDVGRCVVFVIDNCILYFLYDLTMTVKSYKKYRIQHGDGLLFGSRITYSIHTELSLANPTCTWPVIQRVNRWLLLNHLLQYSCFFGVLLKIAGLYRFGSGAYNT